MTGNAPPTTAQIANDAQEAIRRALPKGWNLTWERRAGPGPTPTSAFMTVSAPDGEKATFVVKVMRSPNAQTLVPAVDQMGRLVEIAEGQALPLIVAAYLGPRSREVLIEREVSYVDATGNLRLSTPRPGLFLNTVGATKDPSPEDRPLRSLRGRGAGRAIRALVDFRPPYGVRDLATRAGVSPATLSRTIGLLENDALLTRDDRGGVADLDWAATIRRWSRDYELRRSNAVTGYLEPRGLSTVIDKLRGFNRRYAVTTSLAAQTFAPVAPSRSAVFYVEDSMEAADKLGLRPSDVGANAYLVEPYDPVVFERTMLRDGLVIASPSQVAADLLTGPGREPSEGEELLDWMKSNDDAWRT
jgi:DNA-binding transcriptional ArsR family regulator